MPAPRRALGLLRAFAVVGVGATGAGCGAFKYLPCEDDINCPHDEVCCDNTCMREDELDPEDADDPVAVEAGCGPR